MIEISKPDAELVIEVLEIELQKFRARLAKSKADAQMCMDRIAQLYAVKRRIEGKMPVDIREAS